MALFFTWVTVVVPLLFIGVQMIAWGLLMYLQTPRNLWRRLAINTSLFFVLFLMGGYLIHRGMVRAGFDIFPEYTTRAMLLVTFLFSVAGAPETFRRLRYAIKNRPKG